MAGKISEYSTSVITFADGDLVDVSKRISVGPDVFESQKLEFTAFQTFIQANASNVLNTNGLTLGGNYTHDLDSKQLSFTNGVFFLDNSHLVVKATSAGVVSVISAVDFVGGLILDIREDGSILQGQNLIWNQNNKDLDFINGDISTDGRLELKSVTDGVLINRVDNAQMAAITNLTTDLVVLNTEEKSLYRYDGANWVSMASGYGLFSVNDSSGTPTFYIDLQTACNATADIDTVYIHSDIELTTTVTIPSRTSFTLALNGNRIWGDTTAGDFSLFTTPSIAMERSLHTTGGGIIETIGTASNKANAAPFVFVNIDVGFSCYFNDTKIRSINADCFYTSGLNLIDGGVFYSENEAAVFSDTSLLTNILIDVYNRPVLALTTTNSDLYTRFQGFSVKTSESMTGCTLRGSVTQSGNFGLAHLYGGSRFTDNYVEEYSDGTRPAMFVRGSSSGVEGEIARNVVINRGSSSAGQLVYGSCYDNFFYAENGEGLNVGGNCKGVTGNTCITESSTAIALNTLGDYCVGNTAICLNTAHTGVPMYVGGVSNEVYDNKAICYNASTNNIKLFSSGTVYLANNTMSKTGAGLDLNGNTNSMTNTPDTYGNLQIG